MNELLTFTTADKRFTLTVKGSFQEKCPDYTTHSTYALMTKYKINQFLHNPKGPAIVRLKDSYLEYWLDGLKVSQEVGEKIAHDYNFNNKFMEVIEE